MRSPPAEEHGEPGSRVVPSGDAAPRWGCAAWRGMTGYASASPSRPLRSRGPRSRSPASLFDIRPRRRGVDERARSPRDHRWENAPGTTARPSECAGAAHGVREDRSPNVRRSGVAGCRPRGRRRVPAVPAVAKHHSPNTVRQAPVAELGAPRDAAAHPRVPTTGSSSTSARSHHGLPRTSRRGPRWSRQSRTEKPVSVPRIPPVPPSRAPTSGAALRSASATPWLR